MIPGLHGRRSAEAAQGRAGTNQTINRIFFMDPKQLRIVFMGTPEFAVPSLRALVDGGYNVVAVVTAPDKPAGRGQKLRESEVKVAAREAGIPVLQPEKLRAPEFVEALRALRPDLGIVIAFRMLPETIWAMPRFGTFNLHASLLPRYRGAAPINRAVMNGDAETGVTTFLLNHEIDKGAILGQIRVPIQPEDTAGSVYERLMHVGTSLVTETVDRIASGEAVPVAQCDEPADSLRAAAPKIFREDCRIDWRAEGVRIVNLVRGLAPAPSAWSRLCRDGEEGIDVKIHAARFLAAERDEVLPEAGTVESDLRTSVQVVCGDGRVALEELQLAGKRRMTVEELLRGFRDIAACRFE